MDIMVKCANTNVISLYLKKRIKMPVCGTVSIGQGLYEVVGEVVYSVLRYDM